MNTHVVRATRADGTVYLAYGDILFPREKAIAEARACNRMWPEIKFDAVDLRTATPSGGPAETDHTE